MLGKIGHGACLQLFCNVGCISVYFYSESGSGATNPGSHCTTFAIRGERSVP